MARMDQLDKVLLITTKHVVDCYDILQVEKEIVSCLKDAGSALAEVAKDKPSQKQVPTKNSQNTIPFPSHLEHPQQTRPKKEDCKIFQ